MKQTLELSNTLDKAILHLKMRNIRVFHKKTKILIIKSQKSVLNSLDRGLNRYHIIDAFNLLKHFF